MITFQAPRFFYWIWSTCTCKDEGWKRHRGCNCIIIIRNCKFLVTNLVSILAFSTIQANFKFDLYIIENYYFWQVESSDLIAYGLIPEFVGRFPILVSLSALTENQLIQVGYIFVIIKLGHSSFFFYLKCISLFCVFIIEWSSQ